MMLPIVGVLLGIAIGLLFPLSMPVEYGKFMAVALLASLESLAVISAKAAGSTKPLAMDVVNRAVCTVWAEVGTMG